MATALAAMIASVAVGAAASGAAPDTTVRCGAPAPAPGASFSGPVLRVIDGRTFCVAQGPTPSSWLKVTVAGDARGADRAGLMAAIFARRVTCVTYARAGDGVLARCALAVETDAAPAQANVSVDAAGGNCLKPD